MIVRKSVRQMSIGSSSMAERPTESREKKRVLSAVVNETTPRAHTPIKWMKSSPEFRQTIVTKKTVSSNR